MQCPLLYRFRVIDKLPEKPSEAATRGTLVHAVLERLFDAPAGERTAPRAVPGPGEWERLPGQAPELAELFAEDERGRAAGALAGGGGGAGGAVVHAGGPDAAGARGARAVRGDGLESGLQLRGIIDRVDVAPTGEVRIVDYKTGKAPRPEYAEGAALPDEVLRAGGVAAARRGARAGSSWSIWAAATS